MELEAISQQPRRATNCAYRVDNTCPCGEIVSRDTSAICEINAPKHVIPPRYETYRTQRSSITSGRLKLTTVEFSCQQMIGPSLRYEHNFRTAASGYRALVNGIIKHYSLPRKQ